MSDKKKKRMRNQNCLGKEEVVKKWEKVKGAGGGEGKMRNEVLENLKRSQY